MSTPRLSAIVVAPEGPAAVATTVRHLNEQTAAAEIELVLVMLPGHDEAARGLETGRLAATRTTTVDSVRSNAAGYAAGIRAATGEVVVLCEDHSYPDPGWAAALLAAYAPDVAAVGPVVTCANPTGAVAWADFLLGYGPWLDPTPSADVEYLPGHNSSYRRELVLEYEPELEAWFEAESVLHWDLRRRGYRLRLESGARTHHFNFSRPSSWLTATYLQSRTFGGRRVADAGRLTRLAWLLAVPLIPLVRLRRTLRDVRRLADGPSVARLLPALLLALLVSATGEAVGYARGTGTAPQRVYAYEFLRTRHVNARDREAMAAARFWDQRA